VIHSLVKKPGAFRRYRYREDLFPRLLFRLAYDELRENCPETSDRQYLKILQWAADEGEAQVEAVLRQLVEQAERIRADRVRKLLDENQGETNHWQIQIRPVQLSSYDALLSGAQEALS
jgi:hypothetical protein